jgi:hypothetical protein
MSVTTGWEGESLFAVWKLVEHQAVYADPHRIPFASSLYNWGFYYFYGLAAEACLRLFHLDAVWISTAGRIVTAAFTLATGVIFFLAQKHFVRAGLFVNSRISWAWCTIAALSPLAGFASISVRPDIGALAFESAGLYAILRYVSKPSVGPSSRLRFCFTLRGPSSSRRSRCSTGQFLRYCFSSAGGRFSR